MIVAAMMQTMLIIIPKKRAMMFLVMDQHLRSSTPKKSEAMRSIVERPQRKPKTMPPKSACSCVFATFDPREIRSSEN